MIPATTDRVAMHTAPHINAQIRRQIEENVAHTVAAGSETIALRPAELDHEWDVERALEANASGLMLLGLALGAWVDRRWFLLPAVAGSFLLQLRR